MNNKNILLNIVGLILCFIMFSVSMLYVEQAPLLILIGIMGLSGFSYLVYQIESVAIASKK